MKGAHLGRGRFGGWRGDSRGRRCRLHRRVVCRTGLRGGETRGRRRRLCGVETGRVRRRRGGGRHDLGGTGPMVSQKARRNTNENVREQARRQTLEVRCRNEGQGQDRVRGVSVCALCSKRNQTGHGLTRKIEESPSVEAGRGRGVLCLYCVVVISRKREGDRQAGWEGPWEGKESVSSAITLVQPLLMDLRLQHDLTGSRLYTYSCCADT